MQTRKCHADAEADADANANANVNADANRIRTKNNMSPSPSVGDIISANSDSRNDKDAEKFYAAGFRRVWFIANEQGRL